MKTRAKRLAEYLEKKLGWTVYESRKVCACGRAEYGEEKKFCSSCGKKLKIDQKLKKRVEKQLEEAIVFALGEEKEGDR